MPPRASWHVIYPAIGSHIPVPSCDRELGCGVDRVRCGMRNLLITVSPDCGTHAVLGVNCGLCGRTNEGDAVPKGADNP